MCYVRISLSTHPPSPFGLVSSRLVLSSTHSIYPLAFTHPGYTSSLISSPLLPSFPSPFPVKKSVPPPYPGSPLPLALAFSITPFLIKSQTYHLSHLVLRTTSLSLSLYLYLYLYSFFFCYLYRFVDSVQLRPHPPCCLGLFSSPIPSFLFFLPHSSSLSLSLSLSVLSSVFLVSLSLSRFTPASPPPTLSGFEMLS